MTDASALSLRDAIAPPPFLLGTVLLFWGWQNEMFILGMGMALLVELPRWSALRLEFSDKDFNHLADLSTVLWLGVAGYLFVELSLHGLFTLFKLLPLLLFPLFLAQRFSTVGSVRLSSLFWSLRRASKHTSLTRRDFSLQRIDLSYPYVLCCLLSSSVARHHAFFFGLALIAAWILWSVRPQRYSIWLWGSILVAGLSLGYAGQLGLQELQHQVERWMLTWFEYHMWRPRDPYQQTTAIGDIGALKQSNTILLRVAAEEPLLLREASYTTYLNGVWRASQDSRFQNFTFPKDEHHWQLVPNWQPQNAQHLSVTLYPYRGKAMLPLPTGTYALTLPSGPDLAGNPLGAVKTTEAPGMLRYRAAYTPRTFLDSAPGEHDLRIPTADRDFFKNFAAQLGLNARRPHQAVSLLEQFFIRNFKYSLYLKDGGQAPLRNFLEQRRSGHCEYFATSTVLLLRAAGIPARYASGYAVQEYSALQGIYLVRQRHAHSWALVYLDGRWQDIDTTPSEWAEYEAEQTDNWWRPGYDFSAWLYYQIARLRWAETEENTSQNNAILWLLIPLILLLGWRLARHKNTRRPKSLNLTRNYPGEDSPFYRICEALQADYPRASGETLDTWLQRLASGNQLDVTALQPLLSLHYRYRFDPSGLNAAQYRTLHDGVQAWLLKFRNEN